MMERAILETESATTIGLITMDPPSTTYIRFVRKHFYGYRVSKSNQQYFLASQQHVIVIHCNSGKGRTGTAICALLLYMGFCTSMEDCLRFYGYQRFSDGKGVSQPCQLRYLYYFEGYYKKQIKSPAVKRLTGITFDSVPNVQNGGCDPGFDIYSCNGMDINLVYSHRSGQTYKQKTHKGWIIINLTEQQTMSFTLRGDTKIIFKHAGSTTICRIMFNTAFI